MGLWHPLIQIFLFLLKVYTMISLWIEWYGVLFSFYWVSSILGCPQTQCVTEVDLELLILLSVFQVLAWQACATIHGLACKVLEIQPKASCMLGKRCTNWANPLPTYAVLLSKMNGMCSYSFVFSNSSETCLFFFLIFLFFKASSYFVAQAALSSWSSSLCHPKWHSLLIFSSSRYIKYTLQNGFGL